MILNGKAINPGEMRTQVKLLRPTVETDAGGFQRRIYSQAASVWARWTNAHGAEVWAAEAQQAIAPATILIRYRSDIDATWRVLKGAQMYEIVSLDNIQERNEYIELKLKRVGGG